MVASACVPILQESHIDPAIRAQIDGHQAEIVREVERAIAGHAVVVVGMAQNPFPRKARRISIASRRTGGAAGVTRVGALLALALAVLASPAQAYSVTFTDLAGDAEGSLNSSGDFIALNFDFDGATGSYTATFHAAAAQPFYGAFRLDLNLVNVDLAFFESEYAVLSDADRGPAAATRGMARAERVRGRQDGRHRRGPHTITGLPAHLEGTSP